MKKSKGKFSLKNLKLKEKINIKNTISNIKEKRTKNKNHYQKLAQAQINFETKR